MDPPVTDLVQATLLGDAIAASQHAVFVTEEDTGRIVAVNEAGCALLGVPRDRLLERSAREFSARSREEADEVYRRLRTSGASVQEQALLRRADGTLVEIGYWGSHTRIGGVGFLLTVSEPIERARDVSG